MDRKYFKKLVINLDSSAEELVECGGEWNKADVLMDLNESEISECYPGVTGWANYVMSHVLMDVDYDQTLVEAFLNSATAMKLWITLENGGIVTIAKCE